MINYPKRCKSCNKILATEANVLFFENKQVEGWAMGDILDAMGLKGLEYDCCRTEWQTMPNTRTNKRFTMQRLRQENGGGLQLRQLHQHF